MTYLEQLASVNGAIKAIEGGAQEYSIGSRRVRRADLSALYAERRRLEPLAAKENGGGGMLQVARFDRR